MTSDARPERDAAHRLPLEGIRVADITVVWAGPHVTQLLGEWGADIVRVEPVTTIQPYSRGAERISTEAQYRYMGSTGVTMGIPPDFDPGKDPWNRSPAFNSHARNKRSMACDIRLPEGREAFFRLIEQCDVIVENNVPETIERAKITYEILREVNPRLIMLRMPAYGLSGPYKNYRGFGTHVEGMIGHHLIRTYDDGTPDETGDAYTADAIAGVMGAWAVTAALRHRARTGHGQQIEMPLAESFLPVIGEYIMDYTMNRRATGQQGNRHPARAPHGIYPTTGADQWIAIDVASDEEFGALCGVLGAHALATDERFRTAGGRVEQRTALDAALGEVTRGFDKEELFHALQAVGVVAGPVHNDVEATRSPQLEARGFFEELTMEGVGTHRYPGIFTKWANTPNWIRTPPVKLGEHNQEIYVDLLGYSQEEYDALCARGLVGTTYTPEVLRGRD
ncbi:MAG: CoA transferase [Chloroflexi bacterium]|nr:CoA transferase [Chloroflexota bacterium]